MRYTEFYSSFPLNNFVECFWTLDGGFAGEKSQAERILPDGCVEVILNFAEPFAEHDEDSIKVQPRNFIVGQMTRPILISPSGRVQLIGIRFHPGGTTPFFSVPMHELTNQVVELGCVARNLERELLSRAVDLPKLSDKVFALEAVLTNLLRKSKNDFRLLQIAAKIVQHSGMIAIDDLAIESGLSNRQLERRFLTEVGLGPKLFSRILRFQEVFRAVDANEPAWTDVALDCGYYDQAHLIKDFRQFAHQTPAVLFTEQSELTKSFTRKSRTSGFSNTN